MRVEEQQRLLGILKHGFDNGGGEVHGDGIVKSPLADFTCRELLATERQVFFRDTPLFMGLTGDLPQPGRFWADSQTGLPILMTRDDEGVFRAFANSCRHRGAQVVPDGRGKGQRFSCPFHAWTYGSDGALLAVNREQRFGTIDKCAHGLIELPAVERHGMLWVKPTPGGEIDVDAMLSGLEDDMAHWDLGSHRYAASQLIEAPLNWKLAIDTFGENYHFDVLHRKTLADDLRGNLQTHDTFGPNYRMVFAVIPRFEELGESTPNLAEWPFRPATLCVYFVYPNTVFLVDGGAVDVIRIFPDGDNPGRSRTAHSFYVTPETRQDYAGHRFEERFEGFNAIVKEEDYHVAASTQRSAEAGIQSHVLFGRNEPALLHYHNAHRSGLGRPPLEVETA